MPPPVATGAPRLFVTAIAGSNASSANIEAIRPDTDAVTALTLFSQAITIATGSWFMMGNHPVQL